MRKLEEEEEYGLSAVEEDEEELETTEQTSRSGDSRIWLAQALAESGVYWLQMRVRRAIAATLIKSVMMMIVPVEEDVEEEEEEGIGDPKVNDEEEEVVPP